ncbi:subtilisin-like protease SBT4.6 [Carica papaya]|uniref:subtilisin-like protease SBT4.6 n=1 Tax=Carica papaya TaxID=3649 RepID=UPI000B8CA2EE|nr:subtilisin-like protease SBT4.6 [Carica papaya]
MGSLPKGQYFPAAHHVTMLQDVVGASFEENLLIRSYRRSFNGFSAMITDSERKKLAAMKGVVSVFPSRIYQLHTTRSWGFMGFNETTDQKLHDPKKESEVIIGVIDTGIWPESESFSNGDLGPAPKKWKGACNGGSNFTCNHKLIGARYYTTDSARDSNGHGSHTASTAAGNAVKNVSFYGLAQGTATGGVPFSRIAAYKVCDESGCSSQAILAAFDDAIADGVDVISISIGPANPDDLIEDAISIGAFHAMTNGILTVQSAGNSGPASFSVVSTAPWILTVAASTIDRAFFDKVILGNGEILVGKSINSFSIKGEKNHLIYGKDVSSNCPPESAGMCEEGCLDSDLVKRKIVVCDQKKGFAVVQKAGGVGAVLKDMIVSENITSVFSLPASALVPDNYEKVKSYLQTNGSVAEILKSETREDTNAPVVASFSSRGPNLIAEDILKPDLTAPGVTILAAFSPLASPSGDPSDNRRVNYNILSGTSMSCPHTSGVAAYVKAFHPDWSPSAVKSAIMTTAWQMTPPNNADAELAYGSGHINPLQSADPGLVYETREQDYIQMLCDLGYGSRLGQIAGGNSTCPENKSFVRDLNYPSMASRIIKPEEPFTITFHRTVTNVGHGSSVYKSKPINSLSLQGVKYPLIHGKNVTKNCSAESGKMCSEGCVNSALVKGKIVLCDTEEGSFVARRAGGVGSILVDLNSEKVSDIYSLPVSVLLPDDYERVKTYLKAAK